MENTPNISVVMCTYNGAKYIEQQIESILAQTHPVYELIVQDDGSTDSTVEIIENYGRKYPIIKLFRNEKRKGYNANFFSAMRKASGDYISISDQDDIWKADKLEEMLRSVGDSLLCFCRNKPFSEDGVSVVPPDPRIPNFGIERIVFQGPAAGHVQFIRRELLDLIPPTADFNYYYDQILQLVAAGYDRISFCDKILVHHRRFVDAATYSAYDKSKYKRTFFSGTIAIIDHLKLYRGLRPEMKNYFSKLYLFLNQLPKNKRLKDALKICKHASSSSLTSYIKFTILSIRLRQQIFYTTEKNDLVAVVRAILFPIYCSEYFKNNEKSLK